MKKLKYHKTAPTSQGYVAKMFKQLKARGFEFVLIVDDKTFTSRAVSNVAWGLGAMDIAARVWTDWHCQKHPNSPLDPPRKGR